MLLSLVAKLAEAARSGPLGVGVYALGYIVGMLCFFPANVLTSLAGFVYGPVWGVAFVWPVSLSGASLAFLIGRTVGRGMVERRLGKRRWLRGLVAALESKGFRLVLLMRVAQLFPFNFLNYALGATRLRFRDFLAGSAIGTLPGTVLLVYAGSLAANLTELGESPGPTPWWVWAMRGAGLAVALGVVVLIIRYARQELAREGVGADPAA